MRLVRALGVPRGELILFHILPWLEHVMWSKCQAYHSYSLKISDLTQSWRRRKRETWLNLQLCEDSCEQLEDSVCEIVILGLSKICLVVL